MHTYIVCVCSVWGQAFASGFGVRIEEGSASMILRRKWLAYVTGNSISGLGFRHLVQKLNGVLYGLCSTYGVVVARRELRGKREPGA